MIQLAKHKNLIVGLFAVNLSLALGSWLMPGLLLLTFFVLPLSTAALVAALSRKQAVWALGALSTIFLLAFGLMGMAFGCFLPIWIAFCFPAALRVWWSWCVGVLVLVLGFMLVLPALGMAGPTARAENDLSNVKQIGLAIQFYSNEHHTFPERLSDLHDTITMLRVFVSPRGAGGIDVWREGPLLRLFREPFPGPERQIASWSEVDGGDYLYRKPPANAPINKIWLMTRPGLLYRDWINVGFVDSHVERLEPAVWKHRPDVIEFLKQTGAAPP